MQLLKEKPKFLSQSNFGPMRIKLIWLIGLTLNSYCVLAQLDTTSEVESSTEEVMTVSQRTGTTSVQMSPELSRYLSMMDSLDTENLKPSGYRIQIFSAAGPNGKKSALTNQSDFLKTYEKTSSYTLWNYPSWVVRVGDYRTYLAALEFHMEIRELYPASFIVRDEIKVDYSSK